MKRERRKPTKAEWESITSGRPVVRKIPPEKPKMTTTDEEESWMQRTNTRKRADS